ncbi:carboxylesterase [Tamaricihabitans halophyticus]|uniref:Carboxylesterase n=1 Tax=Tamaricihabitans halophyticus TaxID=1262583 RepID=A0A4R2QY46_9PSEU|nr:alpha/beta fold hydrolase [Tamaricihabitans halophyticus]TCP55120.1 carboxylesterase [Tamaricihabitans halophyticus]
MPVIPGAEPFAHSPAEATDGIAVLLCHGFTGTPQSMRPWGEYLAKRGYAVSCPRLPGHGTSWQECNRSRWPDWYECVRAELAALRGKYAEVYVFGQSMGGTLTLRLAQQYGPLVSGIALVNPSVLTTRLDAKLLPVASRLVPSLAGIAGDIAKPGVRELSYDRLPLRAATSLARLWRLVRRDLPLVTQPLLMLHSTVDHVVEPVNAQVVLDGVRSTMVTEVTLTDSFHVATMDNDAPTIFAKSVEFLRAVHAERATAVAEGR